MERMSALATPADELTVEHRVTRAPVSRAQRISASAALAVLGLVTIWRFGVDGHHDRDAKIQLGASGAAHVPHWSLPAAPTAWAAGVVTILLGLLWLAVP